MTLTDAGDEARSEAAERAAEPGASRTAAPSMEGGRVVRVVRERRPCMKCGYDLRGQGVVGEPHYGWAVVRCPECGLVTPMHGFAMSRRVANLSATLLGVLWLAAALTVTTTLGFAAALVVEAAFKSGVSGWGAYDFQMRAWRELF